MFDRLSIVSDSNRNLMAELPTNTLVHYSTYPTINEVYCRDDRSFT